MESKTIIIAFGLTLIAGLSTGIGSLLAFFTKQTNTRFLSTALGFSAGVMIYVSFMELIPQAKIELIGQLGDKMGTIAMLISFFSGIAVIALIDFLVPKDENPHEVHGVEEMDKQQKLKRTGILVALSIGIHNFPEGIATFAAALTDLQVAIPIVVAIAIHNIPEGIAVSIPIYHATGSRKKALWYSILSGFSEPLGALFGMLFLLPYWNPIINGVVLSAVSGIMIFISLDELLPAAQRYGKHHHSIAGLIAGMMVVAISLLLMF